MQELMTIIIVAMGISIVVNVFLKRHQIPPIIGYIFSGVVITELFGLQEGNNSTLHEVAEFGIAFLMFTIALEFSIGHLKAMRREVLAHGGAQVVISMTLFTSIAYFLFNIEIKSSLIIGAALSLSSTAIVLKMFNERGETNRTYGRQALGILLFQDLAIIPIFLMISVFTNTDQSLGILLGKTFLGAAVTLIVLYFLGKYAINHFLSWVSDTNSQEIFVLSILLIVISASMLAHVFGISYSLGAFFAGLLIAETQFKHQFEADLVPFRDILLGVFFVTVGMQIELSFLIGHIHIILVVMTAVMLVKFFIITSIIWFSTDKTTALKTGLALAQVGEFSFAVFELARTYGLIEHSLNQTMVIAVVLSMILTPFMLKNLQRIVNLIKTTPTEGKIPEITSVGIDHHVVVCGYSHLGRTVVNRLKEIGLPYIVIENQRKLVEMAVTSGDAVMLGNASQRSILESANVKTAAAVIIAVENEQRIRLLTEAISAIAKNANIIVKVSDKKTFAELEGLPVDHLIDEHEEVAKIMVEHALSCEVKPEKAD